MSVGWMSAVWTGSEARGTARLVLLALADNARDDDGVAWPSVATLARKCRVDERTVQRAIGALVELQEVAVEPQRGCSNRYRLLIPRTPVNLSPRQIATPGGVSPTPGNLPPDPRQPATSTPGNLPPKPLGNHQRTVREPRRQGRRLADDAQWGDQETGVTSLAN